MADLLIKPLTGAGNTVTIQDQAGGAILTSGNSGATITNATLNSPTISGDVLPSTDATQDLGSSAKRWDNIFTTDLHLANERGNWTVIEEEDYLTLRNNKTDKIYKLIMEEVK
jgi:hypothetical protein